LYSKWAGEYNKATNIRVNYQSVGSGAGIKQIEAKTVTFGASDMPLTDEKLKESGLFQFPTVIGGVVPVINLKGIEPGQLRLTGTVIADIFLGKITKWNDNAIKVLNPTLALPEQAITVVRRADGSGTTFIWTNYLSKVSKEFKDTIGDGTAVNWKVGAGGKGNEGVAAMVRQLPGTLGYVEFAYVKQTKMNWVNVQNSAGTWVAPTEDAFKAAAANADWNKTYYQILTNQEGKEAWPISGATFILVHTKPTDATAAKTAINFFDWAFTNGDKAADDLDYVALPLAVKNKIRADWKKLALH
jgi:phosphate transport system substrate-binding protein